MMGCSAEDSECNSDEKPPHQVTITRGFWMGQTPVTVGAYKRFVRAVGHLMPPAAGRPRSSLDVAVAVVVDPGNSGWRWVRI